MIFKRRNTLARKVSVTAAALGLAASASAQMEDVEIRSFKVTEGIYMLSGRGGNIGVSVGEDATFIIDDQFAPLTDRIVAAIGALSERPVDYVLNTHWHYDHTGGNENFGERGALIMAHDNVHKRMAAGQSVEAAGRIIEPAVEAALPVITFNDELTLRVNGQTIHGVHIHHAHTDGDVLVYFEEGNVIHMGDTFFNGRYPFIDLSSGGHINGVIEAAATALAMGDDDTTIIPGHGALAGKRELRAYHAMLVAIRDNVAALMAEGKSRDEVLAAKPTADFDAAVDPKGFIGPDRLVGFIFDSLSGG